MADAIFEHPRLAQIYDALDADRSDLDAYLAIARELGARRVLDIGCGTGTFALLLAGHGFDVVGLDPAAASLDVARAKPGADRVRWIHGDARALPPLTVDLVTMTGNVAQAIADPGDWAATLAVSRRALRPGGQLVFETRDPARRAWEEWTREQTYTRHRRPRRRPGRGLEPGHRRRPAAGDLRGRVRLRLRRRGAHLHLHAGLPRRAPRSSATCRCTASSSSRCARRPTGRAASSCSWPGVRPSAAQGRIDRVLFPDLRTHPPAARPPRRRPADRAPGRRNRRRARPHRPPRHAAADRAVARLVRPSRPARTPARRQRLVDPVRHPLGRRRRDAGDRRRRRRRRARAAHRGRGDDRRRAADPARRHQHRRHRLRRRRPRGHRPGAGPVHRAARLHRPARARTHPAAACADRRAVAARDAPRPHRSRGADAARRGRPGLRFRLRRGRTPSTSRTAATRCCAPSAARPTARRSAAASCCCRARSRWRRGSPTRRRGSCSTAGDGLDELAAAVHTWQRSLPAHPGEQPVTLNVWEAVYFDHDLSRLTTIADRAARIGVERFVLDDGWFGSRRDDTSGLGDWWVSPDVWPDGLRPAGRARARAGHAVRAVVRARDGQPRLRRLPRAPRLGAAGRRPVAARAPPPAGARPDPSRGVDVPARRRRRGAVRPRHRLRQVGPQPRPARGGQQRGAAAGPPRTSRTRRTCGCSTTCARGTRRSRGSRARPAAGGSISAWSSTSSGSGPRT